MKVPIAFVGAALLLAGGFGIASTGCGGTSNVQANPTPSPSPTPAPTVLSKGDWQVDLVYPGGSQRLLPSLTQTGGLISGSNRDNLAELDIATTGSIVGNAIHIVYTLSNGGSPRGTVTCDGTISGSPQTISGTFTSSAGGFLSGASGTFTMR